MKRRTTIKPGAILPPVPKKLTPMSPETVRELQDCARDPELRRALEIWSNHLAKLIDVHEHNAIVARQTLETAQRILAEVLPA